MSRAVFDVAAQVVCGAEHWKGKRVHLVGVAGAGMQALADVLLASGAHVSGSDAAAMPNWLATERIASATGHSPDHVPAECDLLAASAAVPDDNCEWMRAAELGIARVRYAELLGRLTADRDTLAVAGTHGKSTTVAMLANVLTGAGFDPLVVCGAAPHGWRSGGRAGGGGWAVVEACEYQRHFLELTPTAAAILNIEPDHFDCYATQQHLLAAFAEFAVRLGDRPLCISTDCPAARQLVERQPRPVITFALDRRADWQAGGLEMLSGHASFDLVLHGQSFGRVRLQAPGRHQAANALAAAALAHVAGVDPAAIASGLSSFRGVQRRLEFRGSIGGVDVFDDYAHHPTEIAAGLATLRAMYPDRRIWCIFRPHQGSRTGALLDEFAQSLQNADVVLVAEVFRAREGPPAAGEADAARLARAARRHGVCVPAAHSLDEVIAAVSAVAPGDVLAVMSAGDSGKLWDGIAHQLRTVCPAG